MIASLRGNVLSATQTQAIIDVAGVGYLVHITPATALTLRVGTDATLMTSLILREDSVTLFGFLTTDEQSLFDLLLSVSGVGPKSALAILAAMSTDDIRTAVASEDDRPFKSVTGIGPKTAKLIIVQLAGKLGFASGSAEASSSKPTAVAEVIDALMGLGWAERQAAAAVQQSAGELGVNATKEQLLRDSLNRLARSKSVVAE